MLDSIIFDLDGTMWDTTEDAARIWSEIAKRSPDVTDEITGPKLKSLYGLPLVDIAELKEKTERITGTPASCPKGDRVVAEVIGRNGDLQDVIYSVKE